MASLKYLASLPDIRPKMDTRNKLKEARYFLEALIRKENEPKEFIYNLSAFLSAWTSVPDIMLYDFAEHYRIGLTHEDRMMPHDFEIVAKARKNTQALQFFKWWKHQLGILSDNRLWNMRNIIVHRGYEITYRVYIPPSMSSSSLTALTTPITEKGVPVEIIPTDDHLPVAIIPARSNTLDVQLSDLPDLCKKGFVLMKRIVKEAEEKFDVLL